MKLKLERYRWFREGNILVTGHILEGMRQLRNKSLADHFSNLADLDDFRRQLLSANGQFSIIVERENETWAACDRLRNFPLFYTKENNDFIISDNGYSCLNYGNNQLNSPASAAFLTSGYVINNLTLVDDIFQIEAGSYVVFGKTVVTGFYHTIIDTPVLNIDAASAGKRLEDLLVSVFHNHFRALNEKFIAISLSGGYDSRLIAVLANKFHPSDMLCFTYGRQDNAEACKARKVTDRLGVKWVNIEYNQELVRDFVRDPAFHNYFIYASSLTSMFFLSDYFAVKYLKDKNLIPDGCVFIPGHSGDFLAGSHLYKGLDKSLSGNDLVKAIYSHCFNLVRLNPDKKSLVCNLVKDKIPLDCEYSWLAFENWVMKERQAKFIVNSANVYRWFGYDYDLPFWDNSFIDFFSALPFNLKLNKRLYDNILENAFFKDQNLIFDDDVHITSAMKQIQKIKDNLKLFLPYKLVTRFTEQKSPSYYDEITKLLRDDMDTENIISPIQANYFNSYIIQWYLHKTRELLKKDSSKADSLMRN